MLNRKENRMNYRKAIYEFLCSFGLEVYEENGLPIGRLRPKLPYITYCLSGFSESSGSGHADIRYKDENGWSDADKKADSISAAIGDLGAVCKLEDGLLIIKKSSPFIKSVKDKNDCCVRCRRLELGFKLLSNTSRITISNKDSQLFVYTDSELHITNKPLGSLQVTAGGKTVSDFIGMKRHITANGCFMSISDYKLLNNMLISDPILDIQYPYLLSTESAKFWFSPITLKPNQIPVISSQTESSSDKGQRFVMLDINAEGIAAVIQQAV